MCYCGEEKEERHGRTREDGGGGVETSEAIISGRAVVAMCMCVCVRGRLCVIFVISYGRGLYPMLGLGQ